MQELSNSLEVVSWESSRKITAENKQKGSLNPLQSWPILPQLKISLVVGWCMTNSLFGITFSAQKYKENIFQMIQCDPCPDGGLFDIIYQKTLLAELPYC